jgi:serine/threonine protein phosphatase PrpC
MRERQTSKPDLQDEATAHVQETARSQELDLVVATLTDIGRARPRNEDFVEYYVPPDPQQLAHKGSIYLVADGMGGHQAGEVASQRAVELAISNYYNETTDDVGASLVQAFHLANEQIHNQSLSDAAKNGMGTTLVAAVILGRRVYVANVGDSRAYVINEEGIIQITEDHSLVEEQVRAGLLTPEQARRHPQRNLVTRALGSRPSVEVDLFERDFESGDILLLCSDGLTGRVEDPEIAAIVQENHPHEAVRQLIALANERGGNDNITALIVRAQETLDSTRLLSRVPFRGVPTHRSRIIPALVIAVTILALVLAAMAAVYLLSGHMERSTPAATNEPATVTPLYVHSTPILPESATGREVSSLLLSGHEWELTSRQDHQAIGVRIWSLKEKER